MVRVAVKISLVIIALLISPLIGGHNSIHTAILWGAPVMYAVPFPQADIPGAKDLLIKYRSAKITLDEYAISVFALLGSCENILAGPDYVADDTDGRVTVYRALAPIYEGYSRLAADTRKRTSGSKFSLEDIFDRCFTSAEISVMTSYASGLSATEEVYHPLSLRHSTELLISEKLMTTAEATLVFLAANNFWMYIFKNSNIDLAPYKFARASDRDMFSWMSSNLDDAMKDEKKRFLIRLFLGAKILRKELAGIRYPREVDLKLFGADALKDGFKGRFYVIRENSFCAEMEFMHLAFDRYRTDPDSFEIGEYERHVEDILRSLETAADVRRTFGKSGPDPNSWMAVEVERSRYTNDIELAEAVAVIIKDRILSGVKLGNRVKELNIYTEHNNYTFSFTLYHDGSQNPDITHSLSVTIYPRCGLIIWDRCKCL